LTGVPARRGKGLLPREGGVIGVWAASLAYGLAYALRGDPEPLPLALALAGSVASLLAAGKTWLAPPRERALAILGTGALLTLAAALVRPYEAIILAAALAPLAVSAVLGRGMGLILAGGPLLAGHGGFLALVSGAGLAEALLPVAYSIMTVSIAASRVSGDWHAYAIPVALGAVGTGAAALALCPACRLSGGLLLLDVLARLIPYPFGLYSRIGLRAYGFHEAFRSLALMILAAACL